MMRAKKATGKAKCRACNELIEKETVDIVFSAAIGNYGREEHYHTTCIVAKHNVVMEELRQPDKQQKKLRGY